MNCLLLVETLSTRRLAQSPIKEKDALRIFPDSFAFTLLVGLMASLPTFGIDAPPPKPFGDGRRSRNDLGRTGFGDERLSHELESAPSRLWDDIGSRRPQPDRSVWLCNCWHRKLGLGPTPVIRNYLRSQRHPVCVGNILCNAAAIGSTFAYFTGSSLFFIDALCLKPYEYGVIFGASSLQSWPALGAAGNSAVGGYRPRK